MHSGCWDVSSVEASVPLLLLPRLPSVLMSVMQDLYSLIDKTFRGAYKRTREWEDMYLADGGR